MKEKIMPLALCCALLLSCQKQPSAGFTTDKESYSAGETIKITNTTTDGSGNYSWGFVSDVISSVSTDVNPEIKIPENHPSGKLAIALKTTSSNGKLSSEKSLTVDIWSAAGSVVFWQATGSGFATTTVTSNGYTSTISSEYASAPNCGAVGCAAFNNWTAGTYTYSATDGSNNWNGSFTIQKNSCTKKQLN